MQLLPNAHNARVRFARFIQMSELSLKVRVFIRPIRAPITQLARQILRRHHLRLFQNQINRGGADDLLQSLHLENYLGFRAHLIHQKSSPESRVVCP